MTVLVIRKHFISLIVCMLILSMTVNLLMLHRNSLEGNDVNTRLQEANESHDLPEFDRLQMSLPVSWSTGKTLRPLAPFEAYHTSSDGHQTALVVYIVEPSKDDAVVSSVSLYMRYLSRVGKKALSRFPHMFVTFGVLHERIDKNLMLEYATAGVIELSESKFDSCRSHFLRPLGCALKGFDWKSHEKFVVLDSSLLGPLLPAYWSSTPYSFWAEAYLSLLDENVRLVGSHLKCPDMTQIPYASVYPLVPYFSPGPLAFDRSVMEIMDRKMYTFEPLELTYTILVVGYNMAALHGQPVGHDWRRWLHRSDGHCSPLSSRQLQCVWTDWKGRYPELSRVELSSARYQFLSYHPQEGRRCHIPCDYKGYRDYYGDLNDMTLRKAREHFIMFGSIEGRVCELVPATEYTPHPYETLFVSRESGNYSIITKNYVAWAVEKFGHDEDMANSVAVPNDVPKGRTLVVYAYSEKRSFHRSRIMFFLESTVLADAYKFPHPAVDYVVVTCGSHTVKFPPLPNLRVVSWNKSCFSFEALGVGLATRSENHDTFVCLTDAVVGPFTPLWYHSHWTSALISRISKSTKLVGLSVNCPDGVGRAVPHVTSGLMAFDSTALNIGLRVGIFSPVESDHANFYRESEFSRVVLKDGYNIGSMQTSYWKTDFRVWYNRSETLVGYGLQTGADGYTRCANIDLNIFHKRDWYRGMTPNPMEFLFYMPNKETSNVVSYFTANSLASARNAIASSRVKLIDQSEKEASPLADNIIGHRAGYHIGILMHSMNMDGAPRLLYDIGRYMAAMGHDVTFISKHRGHLEEEINKTKAQLHIISGKMPNTLDAVLGELFISLDLVFVNTIVWTRYISTRPDLRGSHPKIVWVIHESELTAQHLIPPHNFSYIVPFPELNCDYRLRNLLHNADNVVFVADKLRAVWSQYDTGHFQTFRGFVVEGDVLSRSTYTNGSRGDLRASLNIDSDAFVISIVGTICKRKRQQLLVEALDFAGGSIFGNRSFVLLVIGAASTSGGMGDSSYAQGLQSYVQSSSVLKSRVKFFPFSNDALKYVALADLHMSVSVGEGFPLNVLEAMMLGVPVMVTPAGGSEEAIMQSGVDGFVLPPVSTKQELGEAMMRHLYGRLTHLKQIGENGYYTVIRKYSDSVAPARIEKLLRGIMVKETAPQGRVCIVVRTYHGSLFNPASALRRLLTSLVNQTYSHWTALVTLTDRDPFSGLYGVLAQLDDTRVRIIDIPEDVKATLSSASLVDKVIAQCPRDSDWMMVTDLHEWYDSHALEQIDLNADLVAYDYYSQPRDWIVETCNRYLGSGSPICRTAVRPTDKHQLHSNLGSYILNYRRWKVERWSLHALSGDRGLQVDVQVIKALVRSSWLSSMKAAWRLKNSSMVL